eukprot:3937157-Prymnesium_polylepis.1
MVAKASNVGRWSPGVADTTPYFTGDTRAFVHSPHSEEVLIRKRSPACTRNTLKTSAVEAAAV